jgi:hypothetical protein
MAKKTGTGMTQKSNRKSRGRTSISGNPLSAEMSKGGTGPRGSKPNVPEVMKAEVNRAVSAGVKHRGDRRDMSKAYTNNTRHPARGNTPRIDVTTRAR